MRYRIKAITASGQIDTLALDARDAGEAEQLARRQGCAVLAVAPARMTLSLGGRAAQFPLLLFAQELLALLESGIAVVEAIETLVEKETRPLVRHVLETVLERLREGRTLSAALEEQPAHFPELFAAAIRASEKTSDLPEALRRFIAYQNQIDHLRDKIVGATIYPLLLIGVGALVILFLLGYVVPRFSRIYADFGGELPWLSRLLLEWGQMIERDGGWALALLLLAGVAAYRQLRRPALRAWLAEQLWRVPRLGERLRVYYLARCYRTLGMLLRGGIPIVPALEMIEGLLAAGLRPQLAQAMAALREGTSLSRALHGHGLTTPVALRLLRVGEQTGNMGEMMERIAVFHDEETARWLEMTVRLAGPLLMVAIGLLIGLIVVMLYMPIFLLAENIQ